MNTPRILLPGLLLCAVAVAADAAPAEDCSQGPIPDQALTLTLGGKSRPLPVATLSPNGYVSNDGGQFDGFQVMMQDKAGDAPAAAFAVQLLVPAGQQPDGKTFHQLPTEDSARQAENSSKPEIGTWYTDGSALPMLSQVGNVVSLRVEIGQRDSGHTPALIPVGILFCAPAQGDIKAPLRVAGRFKAEVKPR